MPCKKILICGTFVFFVIIGGMWYTHQQRQQHISADRFLSAAIREEQNCLRKLAGWRDHLAEAEKGVSVKLKNCRLKEASIEIVDVPRDACIGLAKGMATTTSKTVSLTAITRDNQAVQEETCANSNILTFHFETTEAGLDWYQQMVLAARRREAREYVDSPDLPPEQRPELNLGTIVARIRHLDDDTLYDFTVALDDGTVLIITQDDELSLENGDHVMIIREEGAYRIRNKVSR